jgi:uncharacterized repeat protein (TIGR03803 family)
MLYFARRMWPELLPFLPGPPLEIEVTTMRSKKPCSAAKTSLAMFVTFLLALPMVPTPAQARKFKVLHTFHGPDGANPYAELVRDTAGNIYGTTQVGGSVKGVCASVGCGTAFKLNKNGKQVWLHSFTGSNGRQPLAGLLRDAGGNLYGTTTYGGNVTKACGGAEVGCGVVFRLASTGKETVLHRFKGTPDGSQPQPLLVEDTIGNLYGTTIGGGASGGSGTVFRVNSAGKETVLYSFTGGSDGCFPAPGVIFDAAGNLYGVAVQGGAAFCNSGYGVVFELDTTGTLTVLHTFGGEDGAYPSSALLFDSVGNLYGTTDGGGTSAECGSQGCGTVFELSPQGGGDWTETVLYNFCSLGDCADGEGPGGGLVRDSSGNLYGTAHFGGVSGKGVAFKLDTSGTETVLHTFTGGADGAEPNAGLIMDNAANLYGSAFFGADKKGECVPDGCGVVFKLIP